MPREFYLGMSTFGVSLRVCHVVIAIVWGGYYGVLFLCMHAIGVCMHRGAMPLGVFNVVFSSGAGWCSISSSYCTPEEGGVLIRISALALRWGGPVVGSNTQEEEGGMRIAVLYY